jgi:hypothetical protein
MKMNSELFDMLKSSCDADVSKAKLTLKLLSDHPAGIGDHSTDDFYKNAEDALAKLTEAQVLEIRKISLPQKELAKLYNVKQPLISAIVNKRKWKHI